MHLQAKGGLLRKLFWMLCMVIICAAVLKAADFQPNSGAKIDEKSAKMAKQVAQGTVKRTIYTTPDAFEKAATFYKGIAKEYKVKGAAGKTKKIPSGQELKLAPAHPISWHPSFGSRSSVRISEISTGRGGFDFKHEDVRDVTAIVVSEKK